MLVGFYHGLHALQVPRRKLPGPPPPACAVPLPPPHSPSPLPAARPAHCSAASVILLIAPTLTP